jgi:hypothetical protein
MGLKRNKKSVIKHYADQMLLTPLLDIAEPHKIIRCPKCDEAKGLEWHRTDSGEQYFKCPCGFKSNPLGPAPFPRKGFDFL